MNKKRKLENEGDSGEGGGEGGTTPISPGQFLKELEQELDLDTHEAAASDSRESDEPIFEVECILDMEKRGEKRYYRVRWKGYSAKDDTWEPESNLDNCSESLAHIEEILRLTKCKIYFFFSCFIFHSNHPFPFFFFFFFSPQSL